MFNVLKRIGTSPKTCTNRPIFKLMQSSGLLLVSRAVFLGGVAAAAPAGERRLAAVEIKHPLVGFVYEPVGRPGVVILLAEFQPDKERTAVGT